MNPDASTDSSSRKLLAAARQLFALRGFDATTVKELADHAGVNVSLVSYHFGGKDGLYRACLEEFGRERLAVARRMLEPPRSAGELRLRVRMFAEEMFRCHFEQPDLTRIIHRECELGLPVAEGIFRTTFIEVFKRMVAFLEAARERGILSSELDPQTLSTLLFGVIVHTAKNDSVSQRYFGQSLREESYRNRVLDHIEQTLIRGAIADRAPSEENSS